MGRADHRPYSEVQGKIIVRELITQGKKHVKASSVVGYCHCDTHKGFVTKELYKTHECSAKQCPFLEKFPDYPFWENLEKINEQKAKKKREIKARKMLEINRSEALDDMARKAQLYCHGFGYAILITRIRKTENDDYIINYVSDNLYNDWSLYFDLAYSLKQIYKKNFWLKHVKLPNGEYASINDWKKINGGNMMDITPIYELKTRLRAAAIAGTNLLSEDFRLKKAVESFAPLSSSSPVFAKINEMTGKLLSDGSPEALLDTITLVDAVITTLGTIGIAGEPESLEISGNSAAVVNAPYSQLSVIIDALTTSGSGNYNTILTAWNETPEIFTDYRVKPALVMGLGASYSELADTAANILKSMGKEIVPLVKMDFDPKGKKEMCRRLNIIEDVCGAEENAFYLEQLENSEKDVRKALICALRHDEANIDKLIELTKTEKGKLKTAALAALISFDCEKSEEFFNEYAKKKPAEVIALLEHASSKWTSELAARLINEALIDDKGNKITLSQAADVDKVKLKIKTDFWELDAALCGKWGKEIEEIYRGFYHKDRMSSMDARLTEAILETNDVGLKSLAAELNSSKNTKDSYVCAEAVTRLLSKEDSSKWFAEQIAKANKQLDNKDRRLFESSIVKVLRKVFFENGKYVLKSSKYDHVIEAWVTLPPREVTQQLKGAVSDAMIKCSRDEYDRVISDWIDESDMDFCKKVGEHFCDNLRNYDGTGFNDISLWCRCIGKCGFYNVKNLPADYFKNIRGKGYTSWIQRVIQDIPGDNGYKLEQARAVIEIARRKKHAWFNIEEFEVWANTMFGHN